MIEYIVGAKKVRQTLREGGVALVGYRPPVGGEQAEAFAANRGFVETRYGSEAYPFAVRSAQQWLPYGEQLPKNAAWALIAKRPAN